MPLPKIKVTKEVKKDQGIKSVSKRVKITTGKKDIGFYKQKEKNGGVKSKTTSFGIGSEKDNYGTVYTKTKNVNKGKGSYIKEKKQSLNVTPKGFSPLVERPSNYSEKVGKNKYNLERVKFKSKASDEKKPETSISTTLTKKDRSGKINKLSRSVQKNSLNQKTITTGKETYRK